MPGNATSMPIIYGSLNLRDREVMAWMVPDVITVPLDCMGAIRAGEGV